MEELDNGKIEGYSKYKYTYNYKIYPDRIEISKLDVGDYSAFIKIYNNGTFDIKIEGIEDMDINEKNIKLNKEKYTYNYESVKKLLESGESDKAKLLYLNKMVNRLLSIGATAWLGLY